MINLTPKEIQSIQLQWYWVQTTTDIDVQYNKYGRPLWFRCNWCNADAIGLVTRKSRMTDRTYEDYACRYHLDEWQPAAELIPRLIQLALDLEEEK